MEQPNIRSIGGNNKGGRWWMYPLFGIIAFIILLATFSEWVMQWMWLDQLNYESIFWTIKETQFLLLGIAFTVTAAYIGFNFRKVAKYLGSIDLTNTPLDQVQINLDPRSLQKALSTLLTVATVVISGFFALAFFTRWDTYFRFHWQEVVGKLDPIFGNDIGFYLFRLPFIELIQNSLSILIFLCTGAMIVMYLYGGLLSYKPGQGLQTSKKIRRQLSLNIGAWLLTLAWGFYLDRYQLLYSESGVVYGASYTDVMINIPVLWILTVLSLILALVVFAGMFKNITKWVMYGGIAIILVSILGLEGLPTAIQKFKVEPNELNLERPYIESNISFTRDAYNLDKIKERSYQAADTLTLRQIRNNQITLDNIRLWDPRLLIQTYRQLQEIRLYYQFYNVDVDRYQTKDGYQQMMLSAREISDDLPDKANTWVNKHLQYTHGYGLVMSPVAQEGNEGVPNLLIKDLPPVSEAGLEVDQPAIYYGEHQVEYRIVNSNVKELDYPRGDDNVYVNYAGNGGIPFSNWFRKLLFTWETGDINILLSNYINENSRFQIWRGVQQRVKKIAPFLNLDEDPYLVLSEGKLYWMQDAYTVSPDYPYSEVYNGSFNYIRNSVKVVVDAYTGEVKFYAVDENDPVLNVYRDIFPDMFKSQSAMPEDLQNHMRYPSNLFKVQMEKYNTYHMTEPQVFYNNEDLWTRPMERYGGNSIRMEPYYLLTKLPGEDQLQYLLISPLTPNNRDNMIGWMAAKSDKPDYGEVIVYKLPKERLIYGPVQIEAKIDQHTDISRQLSLWDQRGSSVIRGNLMVVPIEDSFLYVEPVFLIAEGVDIPQLQRVIVAYGDKIAMEPNLEQSLEVIFGKAEPQTTTKPPVVSQPQQPGQQPVPGVDLSELQQQLDDAQQALQDGSWEDFGKAMQQLKQKIEQN